MACQRCLYLGRNFPVEKKVDEQLMPYINNLVASYIVVFVMLVCLHTKKPTKNQTNEEKLHKCSLPKRIFELQRQ